MKKSSAEIYINICEAAMRVHNWAFDINELAIKRSDWQKSKNQILPSVVCAVNTHSLILTTPADIDFYKLIFDQKSVFDEIIELKNKKITESAIKSVIDKFEEIPIEDFKKKYIFLLNHTNVIAELQSLNTLSSRTFYQMYHFFTLISEKYQLFKDNFENPFTFNAMIILFFLDTMGYEYDFNENAFRVRAPKEEIKKNSVII